MIGEDRLLDGDSGSRMFESDGIVEGDGGGDNGKCADDCWN